MLQQLWIWWTHHKFILKNKTFLFLGNNEIDTAVRTWRSGRDQILALCWICHIPNMEITCWHNSIMLLHGFTSRNPKTTLNKKTTHFLHTSKIISFSIFFIQKAPIDSETFNNMSTFGLVHSEPKRNKFNNMLKFGPVRTFKSLLLCLVHSFLFRQE